MNETRGQPVKWFTELTIVNTETGEIINKKTILRENLRVTDKEIKYIKNGTTGRRCILWKCRKHEQQRLEI